MGEQISRVSITGIDGTGKTTTVNTVADMMSKSYQVGVVSSIRSPSYIIHKEHIHHLFPNTAHKIASIYEKGQELRSSAILFGAFIAHVIMQGRFVEPKMIKEYSTDTIVRDRDRLVDSVVMFLMYGMRGLPIGLMTEVVEMVSGRSRTDDLFLLTTDVGTAFERSNRVNIKRDTHESPKKLEKMAAIYPVVIQSLIGIGHIERWQIIDSQANDANIVSQQIYRKILNS